MLSVPNTRYEMQLQDSRKLRLKIVEDFTKQCRHIIKEALNFAPSVTASHLQVCISFIDSLGKQAYFWPTPKFRIHAFFMIDSGSI